MENPTVAVLDRIAKVLDVPLARFFMPAPEGTPPGLKAGRKALKKKSLTRKIKS
jgi:transcriptional regulator with XRE-family HTH domain